MEAFYERHREEGSTGRRGVVVVTFRDGMAKKKAVEKGGVEGQWNGRTLKFNMEHAYSGRSSSNSWHLIKTWHVM